jgi:AcrR family transcriptional regulator
MSQGARERLVHAAYRLFQENTLSTVGVDRIVAEAGVAKTTLYRYFPSKDDLTVAVLARHQDVWMTGWLEQVVAAVGPDPRDQLLALFDAFDDWFQREDYNGCLFARALLETRDPENPICSAATTGLARVRSLIRRLAEEAGARDPDAFALQLQLIMLGSTVAAVAGELDAARHGEQAATALLEREGISARRPSRSRREARRA